MEKRLSLLLNRGNGLTAFLLLTRCFLLTLVNGTKVMIYFRSIDKKYKHKRL